MKNHATALHRALLLAALPAVLAFAGCGKDDPDPVPVVEQGSILFVNAAANTFVGIKAFVDNEEKTTLTYGVNGGGSTPAYQPVNAGSRTIKIDNAASAGTTFFTQTTTVEKDKKYSLFVYSPNSTPTPAGLLTTDDLTAPASGKAKIRLVHVALGFPVTPGAISLSQSQPVGFLPLTSAVTVPGASGFVEINSGPANLLVTTGTSPTGITVATVGDGTGSGTGTKNYESGKIYTIVVRGSVGNQDPARDAKAFIIQNN
ncbi:DUF4397 domain-containing protein [Hymenobacter persicinus]|uniref:DUF4397 domain-containing protein n=1 Tax=Hymenobacter persicinus TaxID=2025506 RepID=A0A4Q5LK61_9BACT|nr:DUF4397 domain-containing protein [Hymenobacter persicinus]RYU84412.1 DUF4397 domain-containing protein [Hymenobacter persicinus]